MNGFEKPHERIFGYTDAGQSWDGEEVVRCRDCKYATVYYGEHEYREPLFCAFHHMDVKPENFCSWGKARSE